MSSTKNAQDGKGIYTLAYAFDDETAFAIDVARVKEMLEEKGVRGEVSKMGTHLTVFPPFYADEIVAKTYAVMAQAGEYFKKESSSVVSEIRVGWFPPPNSESTVEAIHLRIGLSPEYVSFISRIKRSRLFEWVYPPVSTDAVQPVYVPHVHLFEGEEVINQTKQFEEEINSHFKNKHYPLGKLLLFEKEVWENRPSGRIMTRWEQVLV